ncbi:hypothetical protein BC832DRAFT_557603 [Gaertneriomyces semiglobifer]|nr:hypothetical protein BC832DRAFT_557603 [Gaertneriomyces semiglobifer]
MSYDASSSASPTTDRGPRQKLYNEFQLLDICIRLVAMCLALFNLVLYRSLFKRMTAHNVVLLLCMFTHFTGVILQTIPKWTKQYSVVLAVNLGVFFLMLSSELFNWVLYLRFNLVTPFRRKLKRFVLCWLVLESIVVAGNYAVWSYAASVDIWELRSKAAQVYSYVCIGQAVTALFLSAYFTRIFYLPLLRLQSSRELFSTPSSKAKYRYLVVTSFIYLFLETTLHTSFTILYFIIPRFYSAVNALLVTLRLTVLMVWIARVRKVGKMTANVTTAVGVSSSLNGRSRGSSAEDSEPDWAVVTATLDRGTGLGWDASLPTQHEKGPVGIIRASEKPWEGDMWTLEHRR